MKKPVEGVPFRILHSSQMKYAIADPSLSGGVRWTGNESESTAFATQEAAQAFVRAHGMGWLTMVFQSNAEIAAKRKEAAKARKAAKAKGAAK